MRTVVVPACYTYENGIQMVVILAGLNFSMSSYLYKSVVVAAYVSSVFNSFLVLWTPLNLSDIYS